MGVIMVVPVQDLTGLPTRFPPINKNPVIALVKYQDVIYHCEEVKNTKCGYSISCNGLAKHCVNDLEIEYL